MRDASNRTDRRIYEPYIVGEVLSVAGFWRKGNERYQEIKDAMASEIAKGAKVSMCEFAERMEQRGISRGISQGISKGIELGRRERELKLIGQIVKKLSKGKSPEVIADELEEEYEVVKAICDVTGDMSPDYDVEDIYMVYKSQVKDDDKC